MWCSFSLTWPREAVGTKLVVGESEPSSTKTTTAAAAGDADAAYGVMLHRRLQYERVGDESCATTHTSLEAFSFCREHRQEARMS